MKKHHLVTLKIIGIILIIWGALALINSYSRNPTQIFWISYASLLIIGIGALRKNSTLIAAQLSIIMIPVIFWNIDFFHYLFTSQSLWGITDYFFADWFPLTSKMITFQHVFIIPLSLYLLFIIKLKKKDYWKLSMVITTIFFVASYLLTPRESNVNCVFEPCINISLGLPHQITWFILFFVMIFITSLVLNGLPFLKKTRQQKEIHRKH